MKVRFINVIWALLVASAPVSLLAAEQAPYSGTWSGSFEIHFADKPTVHDTAWLKLDQSGTTVTGTAGPKANEQGPIRDGVVRGDRLEFVADSTQGKILKFTLRREGDRLTGEATGDIGEDRVRVVLDASRADLAATPPPDPLYQKMLSLDTAMFDAFNKCSDPTELAKHGAFFDKGVEFFHDLGGVTWGAEGLLANTRKNVCGQFNRVLDAQSFRVFPIPGYGAITMGTHRFCHTPTTCEGIGEFTTVWRETQGVWQVTRALSYAHRSL